MAKKDGKGVGNEAKISSANTKEGKEGTCATTICPIPGGYPTGWGRRDGVKRYVVSLSKIEVEVSLA